MVVHKDIEQFILIRNALTRKGLKATDIATMIGIHKSNISKYMYGQAKSQKFNQWVKENLDIDLPEHTPRRAKRKETLLDEGIKQFLRFHNILLRKGLTATDIAKALETSKTDIQKYQWIKENLCADLPEHTTRSKKERSN